MNIGNTNNPFPIIPINKARKKNGGKDNETTEKTRNVIKHVKLEGEELGSGKLKSVKANLNPELDSAKLMVNEDDIDDIEALMNDLDNASSSEEFTSSEESGEILDITTPLPPHGSIQERDDPNLLSEIVNQKVRDLLNKKKITETEYIKISRRVDNLNHSYLVRIQPNSDDIKKPLIDVFTMVYLAQGGVKKVKKLIRLVEFSNTKSGGDLVRGVIQHKRRTGAQIASHFSESSPEQVSVLKKLEKSPVANTLPGEYKEIYSPKRKFIKATVIAPYADETLLDKLKSPSLSNNEKIAIMAQLANGLAGLHDRNIVHRDIKADNVLILKGQACIADFDTATDEEVAYNRAGTSTHIPPNLNKLGPKTRDEMKAGDVYSLGITFLEIYKQITDFNTIPREFENFKTKADLNNPIEKLILEMTGSIPGVPIPSSQEVKQALDKLSSV